MHPAPGPVPALSEPAMPGPILDFPHETTRAAVSMIIGNDVHDYPNVKIILSHAGGTLPYMVTRVAYQVGGGSFIKNKSAEDFLDEARKFYFDLALSAYEGPFDLLRNFAKRGHITFGSDFPFAKAENIRGQVEFLNGITKELDRTAGKEGGAKGEGWEVRRGNALRLFPRLAERLEKGEANRQTNGK